jgi:serine/threonine-protein kinase
MQTDRGVRPGQRVGKYVLGERIARGGMAEVWAARVEGPQGFVKSVALKFVMDSGDPEMERLFVNEARVAAGLQHPNLVTVFDFDRVAASSLEPEDGPGGVGRSYIAMERIEGHDLRRVLRVCRERGLRFPVSLSLYVAGEVLQGLRHVHEQPIVGTAGEGAEGATLVHRDVSPHNILVAYSGDVKLSDFGIAKVVTRVPGVQSGLVRGKVAYASPEQLLGQSVDHRSDQFSLGVTLWELLAGHRLFGGTTDVETMNRVLAGDVPPLPSELRVPSAIEAVVRRMLAARPEQRYPRTAAALSAVMALPEYSGDGTALGAWMREQFAGSNVILPATQLLSLSGAEFGDAAGGQRAQGGQAGQGAFAGGDPGLPVVALKVEAGSTQRMDGGRPRSPTGRRRGPGAESPEARSGHRRGGARTAPGKAVHPPIGQLPDESQPEAELPPVEIPVVRAPSGTTGRRRSPAPHSVPVVIDFATRAPLRSGRPTWSRWGLLAALVALATWGAALGIRHSVRLALEPARPLRPIPSRRHTEPDPDPSPPTAELTSTTATSLPTAGPPPPAQPPSEPAPDETPSAPSQAPNDEAQAPQPGDSTATTRHRTLRSNGLSPNGAPIIE